MKKPNLPKSLSVAVLILLALDVRAGGEAEYTLGFGADVYRSHDLNASVDLFGLPLRAEFAGFIATSRQQEIVNQRSFGLGWSPWSWGSVAYHQMTVAEDLFDVDGDEYDLSLNLESLWSGTRQTRIDLGYGKYSYAPNVDLSSRPALLSLVPEQRRRSVGLEQDIVDRLSVRLAYEEFEYTKDPVQLARAIVRRLNRPNNAVFELIAFPDRGGSVGVNWRATDQIALDLSQQRTITVLDQKLENTRLGASYKINNNVRLGAAASHSRSEAIKSGAGATLIAESSNTFYELSLKLALD